ncbi:hypothetical protein ZHAWSFBX_CDS_0046 [Agrobacterium phage Alfirin]|nr:hypothetical protein ZHAWSFBX_CDS_0046 [Agrobacterium phage Alfirin]
MGRLTLCKKYHRCTIHVPYLTAVKADDDGRLVSERTIATFRFSVAPGHTGFCKRKVKRLVRKWLQATLEKKIDIEELRRLIAHAFYARHEEA